MTYYGSKMNVVQFATALQLHFGKDLDLTKITRIGNTPDTYAVSVLTDAASATVVGKEAATYNLSPTISARK